MSESNITVIFNETYGYQIKAIIKEYDIILNDWAIKDISGFTTKQFIVKPPTGSNVVRDASFYTDGVDGIMIASLLQSGSFITELGTYRFQALLSNDTQYFKSSVARFDVEDPL